VALQKRLDANPSGPNSGSTFRSLMFSEGAGSVRQNEWIDLLRCTKHGSFLEGADRCIQGLAMGARVLTSHKIWFASPRKTVRNHRGIAFTFFRILHDSVGQPESAANFPGTDECILPVVRRRKWESRPKTIY